MTLVYALILGTAVLLNLFQPRMLVLTFLTIFFLLITPYALPDPDLLGSDWYSLLCVLELTFAIAALFISAPASRAVALMAIYNALANALGSLGLGYANYPYVILTAEICQCLACLVMSRPALMMMARATRKLKIGNKFDGWWDRLLEPAA